MLYTVLNVGDKEYKCRLTAKACVDLERRMGQNPLNVFTEIQKSNELPKVEDIIMILHASLQALEHNISLDDTYAIYDEFVDEGNTLIELIGDDVIASAAARGNNEYRRRTGKPLLV